MNTQRQRERIVGNVALFVCLCKKEEKRRETAMFEVCIEKKKNKEGKKERRTSDQTMLMEGFAVWTALGEGEKMEDRLMRDARNASASLTEEESRH